MLVKWPQKWSKDIPLISKSSKKADYQILNLSTSSCKKTFQEYSEGGGRNKVQLLKKHYKNIQGERNKVQFLKKYYKNIQGERNKVQVFAYQMSGTTQAVTSLINGIMANYFWNKWQAKPS